MSGSAVYDILVTAERVIILHHAYGIVVLDTRPSCSVIRGACNTAYVPKLGDNIE